MNFQRPIITELGYDMSARVFLGEGNILFTAVHIGKGAESQAPQELTAIVDKVLDATIISYSKQEKSIKIVFSFDNTNLLEGFNWTEYGIIARYDDGEGNTTEGLFCYGYDISDSPENIPRYTGANSYFKAKYNITIAVGNADSVTVDLREYSDFVLEEDFEEHLSAKNPHMLNKSDIGLSNVENHSDTDAVPTFTEASELSNIVSGETAGTLWGKVKKNISIFISHLSANNPHNISPSTIGAARATHSHSTAEINNGVLPIANGGTGYDNADEFLRAFGLFNMKVRTFKKLDDYNGYIIFDNTNMYFEWRRFEITANANSSAPYENYTQQARFAAPPIVVTKINSTSGNRTTSVSGVNSKGYTVYYHNQTNSRNTNFVYAFCLGFLI